jgi:hypothetical protein
MYELKVPVIQNLFVTIDIIEANNLLKKALLKVGHYISTEFQNPERIVLKGNARYGIQIIPIIIELDKAKEANTLVTICGKSSDVAGVGAKTCIARLISTFNELYSEQDRQITVLEISPSIQNKNSVSKKKLLVSVAVFAVLLFGMMQASLSSNYSIYIVDNFKNAIKENLKEMITMTVKLHQTF